MTLGQFTGLNPGISPSKSAQRRRARLPPSAGGLAGREQRGRAQAPEGGGHTRRGASSEWPGRSLLFRAGLRFGLGQGPGAGTGSGSPGVGTRPPPQTDQCARVVELCKTG